MESYSDGARMLFISKAGRRKAVLAAFDSNTANLRSRSIDENGRFLVANLAGSVQERDLTEGCNCQGYGRIHHFFLEHGYEWPANPLPHHVAAWKLGRETPNMERVQVFQIAACNCRCWYCYVDYDLLSASPSRSAFKSAEELLELFLMEENRPDVIDLSGGQPDIVPEWPVRMMEALTKRGLQDDYYLWMDDNLTSYNAWTYLSSSEVDLLRTYKNFGRVGCFKGFSSRTFHENTCAPAELLKRQINIMSRWVDSGIDTYGYITLTTSNLTGSRRALASFLDQIQEKIHPLLPLRVVPLRILPYAPTDRRMKKWMRDAMTNQLEVLSHWKDEIEARYSKEEIRLPIYMVKVTDQRP